MMTSATVYPSLTHGQDDIPKGWHWSARYVLPKPLIWRRPSSDPSKLGEEIAFFFSPSDRSWMIATICHGIAINQGYHGNTMGIPINQPCSEWGSWCDGPPGVLRQFDFIESQPKCFHWSLLNHCFHLESPLKKTLGRASQLATCYIKPMLDCNEMNGGLEHFLFFHSVGNVIIPTDELIYFSEG